MLYVMDALRDGCFIFGMTVQFSLMH